MRRRHDLTAEEYFRHYEEVYPRFGLRVVGAAGSSQFHVDAESTRRACERAGFGIWQVSSVSKLHLASVEEFLAAAKSNAKIGFAEDEEKFIDRRHSVMRLSDEVHRFGAQ